MTLIFLNQSITAFSNAHFMKEDVFEKDVIPANTYLFCVIG
jgi:hypothetical protein